VLRFGGYAIQKKNREGEELGIRRRSEELNEKRITYGME